MVKNGQKWSKLSEIVKIVKNGQKWSKMVKIVKNSQNCQKWSKLSKRSKLSIMVKNCQKMFKLSKIVSEGVQTVCEEISQWLNYWSSARIYLPLYVFNIPRL